MFSRSRSHPHRLRRLLKQWRAAVRLQRELRHKNELSIAVADANNRILRRSVDGATTADMAFIAQEAAMNYERELANRPTLQEEE